LWAEDRARQLRHAEIQPDERRLGFVAATLADVDDQLADAHSSGRLQAELLRLSRYRLLVIDKVCYIPFEPEAANLFFQLVSSRYERASLIVTSNGPFSRWGEVSATRSSLVGDFLCLQPSVTSIFRHRLMR
jgi:DNA replication protein DnaC